MAIATATEAHLPTVNEQPNSATGTLVLADGSVYWGVGRGRGLYLWRNMFQYFDDWLSRDNYRPILR